MVVGVTGANGMLGRHIVDVLIDCGKEVKEITRKEWDIKKEVSGQDLDSIFSDCDAVVHCAALTKDFSSEAECISVNVTSSACVAEWCYKQRVPLIYISGAGCYKLFGKLKVDEYSEMSYDCLGGAYGLSKYLGEQAILNIMRGACTVFRPSSLYGAGSPADRVVAKFLNSAKKNEQITVWDDGSAINFLHCYDVARAVNSALNIGAYGTFNLANEESFSLLDLAKKICLVTGANPSLINVKIKKQSKIKNKLALCFARAQREFGFHPKIDLVSGLRLAFNEKTLPEFDKNF